MIKPLQTHRIISIQRPGLWWLSFIIFIVLILLMIWSAFEYGRSVAAPSVEDNKSQTYIKHLQQQLLESQQAFADTRRLLTMLERNSEIEDGATVQLKASLKATQSEVLTLKRELSLYQSVMAPEKGDRSLAIQKVQISINAEGGYDYKIMVSQHGRHDQFARGVVDVSIVGLSKGQTQTLALAEVSNDIKNPMKFGFRYFQNFEGVIVLPEAFEPEVIRVKVNPGKGKINAIDEQFSWSDLTAEGA